MCKLETKVRKVVLRTPLCNISSKLEEMNPFYPFLLKISFKHGKLT